MNHYRIQHKGYGEDHMKEKLIVLPVQPEKTAKYNGTGLGIHFLLGNIAALHTGLKEFWFGWRVTRIFQGENCLRAYCRGDEKLPDLARLGEDQKIRYWIEGTHEKRQGMIVVNLRLFDSLHPGRRNTIQIPLDTGDHLVGFRRSFLSWLDISGLPMSTEQSAKVLWPEKIGWKGLNHRSKALKFARAKADTRNESHTKANTFVSRNWKLAHPGGVI